MSKVFRSDFDFCGFFSIVFTGESFFESDFLGDLLKVFEILFPRLGFLVPASFDTVRVSFF